MSEPTIIFFLLICIMFLVCIIFYQQFVFCSGIQTKLRKISAKLKKITDTDSDERIMVFAENKELMELAAQINRLLENHVKIKADYRRSEIASKKMLSNISHDIKTPIADASYKPVKNYSLGMKERLGIARAILCKPELLILDEPTNGLDPAGMKQIRDLLKTLCTEYGITIMISSHILSEIESIADTVGVINHGMMVKEIGMKEIEQMSLAYIELSVMNSKKAAYVLTEKLNLTNFKIIEDGKIRIYDISVSTQELSKILALNDVEVVALGKKAETLEDYFLKMTSEVRN